MDDLKVVLYIVVAIIWVVYNNYKKLSEASKKRDLKKPPPEVIQENWPRETYKKPSPVPAAPKQVIEKQTTKRVRPVLERQPIPSRRPIQRTSVATRLVTTRPPAYAIEGGTTTPSKVVQFEESTASESDQHPLLQALKSMDLKQGILMAEILKRPYN